MKREKRYSVLDYAGFGQWTEYCATNSKRDALDIANQRDPNRRGYARIYNNVTGVTMDADGNIID